MSNNANRVNNPMKVITGPDTRWSYANVWEPKSINGASLPVRHLRLRLYKRLWGVCVLNGAAQFHHSSVQYPPVDPPLPGYGCPGGGRHGYGRGGPVYEREIRSGLRNHHRYGPAGGTSETGL